MIFVGFAEAIYNAIIERLELGYLGNVWDSGPDAAAVVLGIGQASGAVWNRGFCCRNL